MCVLEKGIDEVYERDSLCDMGYVNKVFAELVNLLEQGCRGFEGRSNYNKGVRIKLDQDHCRIQGHGETKLDILISRDAENLRILAHSGISKEIVESHLLKCFSVFKSQIWGINPQIRKIEFILNPHFTFGKLVKQRTGDGFLLKVW